MTRLEIARSYARKNKLLHGFYLNEIWKNIYVIKLIKTFTKKIMISIKLIFFGRIFFYYFIARRKVTEILMLCKLR